MNFVVTPSLFHMVLISGERYLAVKNPFLYNTLVTEGRLLAAAALVWFLSVLQQVLSLVDRTIIYRTNFIFSILSIGMIAYCHVRVFIQTRRHALQLAAQQITQEARQKFEKDRKALKLTCHPSCDVSVFYTSNHFVNCSFKIQQRSHCRGNHSPFLFFCVNSFRELVSQSDHLCGEN